MQKLKKVSTTKILRLILAMILSLTISIPVCAATNEGSITISNDPSTSGVSMVGNTYSVFKVFDLTKNGDSYAYTVASDYENFFKGLNGAPQNAGQELNSFASNYVANTDINKVAEELKNYTLDKNLQATFSQEAKEESLTISGLPLGYYMVLGDSKDSDGKQVVSAVSLGTTDKDLVITLKGSAPTMKKEIKHNEKDQWGVVGDNQIGDNVEFRLIGSVPTNLTGYNKYQYIVGDRFDEGFTLNKDFAIKINDTEQQLTSDYFEITYDEDNLGFKINVNILKAVQDGKLNLGDQLYIYYTAVLNSKAKATEYNENTVTLQYSNNPYVDDSFNTTPPSTVRDYTFELDVTKLSDNKKKLAGAEFELSRDNNPIYFIKSDDGKGTNIYKICDQKKHATEGCTKTLVSGESGELRIIGLDDAVKYSLKETKAPTGYNPLKDPIEFTLKATYDEEGNLATISSDNESVTRKVCTNTVTTTIINTSGKILPGTGGSGTKLFTIVGGALMVCAAAGFAIKRKTTK